MLTEKLDTGAGQEDEGGQVAPPPSTDLLDQERWIAEAEAEAAPPAPQQEEEPEWAPEEPEYEAPAPDESTPVDWASVLREAPQRINEVPARQRAQVLEEMRQRERQEWDAQAQEAITRARAEAVHEARQREELQQQVAQLDEFRQTDPEGFAEWEGKYPQRAEAYYRYKADRYAASQPRQIDPSEPIHQASQRILARANNSPEVLRELHNRQQREPRRYAPNADGLANLAADINEIMSAPTPRQQAAEARKAVPRPDNTPAAAPKAGLTKKAVENMSVQDLMNHSDDDLLGALTSSQ